MMKCKKSLSILKLIFYDFLKFSVNFSVAAGSFLLKLFIKTLSQPSQNDFFFSGLKEGKKYVGE